MVTVKYILTQRKREQKYFGTFPLTSDLSLIVQPRVDYMIMCPCKKIYIGKTKRELKEKRRTFM